MFFKSKELAYSHKDLARNGLEAGPWMYERYMSETDEEQHRDTIDGVAEMFKKANDFMWDKLYKKREFMELSNQ